MAGGLLAALLLVPGVLYAVPELAGADDAFNVLSGSMVPFFNPGDVIFIEHVDPTTLQVGDVVTFRTSPGGSTLVTHRVVERLEDGGRVRYITKGDANEDVDPFVVRPEMVEGRYVFQIPHWGLLLAFLHSKWGYFLLILVPGSLIILREGIVLYRELDRLDREREEKKRLKQLEQAAARTAAKEEHALP